MTVTYNIIINFNSKLKNKNKIKSIVCNFDIITLGILKFLEIKSEVSWIS